MLRRLWRKVKEAIEGRGVRRLVEAHRDVIIERYLDCLQHGMSGEEAAIEGCIRFMRHWI